MKKSFEKLMSYMEEGKEEAKTAREEIRIFLERWEVYFADNPYDRNIFFNVMLYTSEHIKEALFGVIERYDAYIRKQYRHLLSKIRLREGISMEMAVEYLSLFQNMYNGYYQNKASRTGDFSRFIEEHNLKISELLDIILYGISTEEKGS